MAFNLLPANLTQYARYLVGNAFANAKTEGVPFDVRYLSDDAKGVVRTAVANARKDGRSFVKYEDYPNMSDGTKVKDFVAGRRDDVSKLDLIFKSQTDPVLEIATFLGRFSFQDRGDGSFEVRDRYDFNEEDDSYTFPVQGIIQPEGQTVGEYFAAGREYVNNFVKAAYDSAEDAFSEVEKLTEKHLPLETIALLREGLNRVAGQTDDSVADQADIDIAAIDLPELKSVPKFFSQLKAKVLPDSFEVTSKLPELDIDIKIPKVDRMFGDIEDYIPDFNLPRPTLPVVNFSDKKLGQLQEAISQRFADIQKPADDELTFSQAFARHQAAGDEVFTWRNNQYTTKLKGEADG
jgi:hypothetical protein